jgi:hypothetical protein
MARIEIGGTSISTDEIHDLLATDHPMVERFQFEQTHGFRSGGLHFALQILPRAGVRYQQLRDAQGHRLEQPVWRTLTGNETIGEGNRAIWREDGELVAENCTFFPNQEFNDLGIGSALYVALERFYRQLGIRRVTLLAVDVGVYVWARQGFAFAEGGVPAGLVRDLRGYVQQHGGGDDLVLSSFGESWDLANCDVPDLSVEGYRVGKAFMLRQAPAWHGIKWLDEPEHNDVAEASRRETFARLPETIEGAPAELAVR